VILYVTSLNKHDFLIDQIKVSKIVHQFKNGLKIFLREIKVTLHFLVIKMRNFAAVSNTSLMVVQKIQSEI